MSDQTTRFGEVRYATDPPPETIVALLATYVTFEGMRSVMDALAVDPVPVLLKLMVYVTV